MACAKTRIRRFFQALGKERAYEFKQQENFYYTCLYDLLSNSTDYKQLNLRTKYYKAKIVQINGQKLRQVHTELRDNMVLPDEQITLYHIIKRNQRRQKQLIKEIQDTDGIIHNNINGIRNVL